MPSPQPPRSPAWALAVVLLGAPLLSAGTGLAESAQRSRQRGLALFKQKRFDAACPLLEAATRAEPTNGAIWADLGLCEQRLGNQQRSVHASLLAARHGDEKVRKRAYFNLRLAGYSLALPGEECAALQPLPEVECSEQVFACTKSFQAYGSAEGDSGSFATFSRDREEAAASSESVQIGMDPDRALSLELEESHACFHSWCSSHGWRCSSSAEVEKRANACYAKRHGQRPADPCQKASVACDDYNACFEQACQDAERAIAAEPGAGRWDAVVREQGRQEDSCLADCHEGTTRDCDVVYVDPCRNRIGYVCSFADEKLDVDRIEAREIEFAGRG